MVAILICFTPVMVTAIVLGFSRLKYLHLFYRFNKMYLGANDNIFKACLLELNSIKY